MVKSKKKNGFFITVLICIVSAFLCCMATGVAAFAESRSSSAEVIFSEATYRKSYAVGESVRIPAIEAEEDGAQLTVYAQVQKGLDVLEVVEFTDGNGVYVVEEEGEYSVTYVAFDSYGKRHTKSYSFVCGDFDSVDVSFKETYSFSETVQVEANAIVGGVKVPAQVQVVSPSGKAVVIRDGGFNANEEGAYTITYTATNGEKEFTETFTVYAVNKGIEDLFIIEKGVREIDYNVSPPSFAQQDNGVRIMASEETAYFRYRNIIDLNGLSKDENIIKVLPLSTGEYTRTAEIHVVLTDIYDPSNTVEFFAYPMYYPYYPGSPDWSHCYVNYDGRNMARNNDGDNGVRTNYGSTIPTHFDGSTHSNVAWIELQVDYAEAQFLCIGGVVNPSQYCILDIDDSTQVGLGKEWKGFTTGEVYLDINFVAEGENSGILISEIAGQKISGNSITDVTAPYIVVDGYSTDAPDGCVGQRYVVPKPRTVYDVIDGELDVAEVGISLMKREIYSYYADVSYLLDDGGFMPTEAGEYRIVYNVTDSSGNVGEKVLNVYIGESAYFEADFELPSTISVGEKFLLEEVTANCYTDIVSSSVQYYFNGEEMTEGAYEYVTFEKEGTFTVKYSFTSFAGEVLQGEKTAQVKISDKPVITASAIPMYALKGKTYFLPTFEAVDYGKAEGSAERYPEKSYEVDGVARTYAEKSFVVEKNAGEKITIRLIAGAAYQEYEITVLSPEYLSDYFIADGEVEAENGAAYLEYTFDGNRTFTFCNPLIAAGADGLNLDFGLNFTLDGASKFDIILADYANPEMKLVINVTVRNGNYYLQLNGKGDVKDAVTQMKNNNKYLHLNVNNLTKKITGVFNISEFSNGKAFAGFESEMVTLQIVFGEVTGRVGFDVYKISDKLFESYFSDGVLQKYEDLSVPSIVYEKSVYEQEIAYDKKVIIPAAQAWSVLSGRFNATVSLRSPSGKNVIYNADAAEENEYVLDEYGSWVVMYTVVSASGLRKVFSQSLEVTNDNVPVYSVGNAPEGEYAVGSSIRIPTITCEEGCTVSVTITTPEGKYIYVEQGSVYGLTFKGIYRLTVSIFNGYHYTVEYYEFKAV